MTRKAVIAGGGPAGMMAALEAARCGADVTLLERNEKLGKKLYITGKGRCNVTNDCTRDEFLQEVARNPRFLYSALTVFPPQRMMAFLEENGCPVTVQRGRRVFPASEKASDVTRTLERALRAAGVRVRLEARAARLLIEESEVRGVELTDGETLPCDAAVVACGGLSYPATGSDGDGYRLAEQAGHTLTERRPSLSALETEEGWPAELQGLSLKNVALEMRAGRRTLYRETGEMLFTHFGISGPLVLEMSCHLPEDVTAASVTLCMKPGLSPEQLDARLQREFAAQPRRQLRNVLPALLPGRMAELFPRLAEVDGGRLCGEITRAERERLCAALRSLPLHIARMRPIAEAIVTRGGVSVKEVDPATMASRKVNGLFFAGEVLDVDAHTGGYNLQIAFATGFLAGRGAAGADGRAE